MPSGRRPPSRSARGKETGGLGDGRKQDEETASTGGGRYIASTSRARFNSADLLFLKDLADTGKLKALVDRVYPLADTVDAQRYVESGGKIGNVVVTVLLIRFCFNPLVKGRPWATLFIFASAVSLDGVLEPASGTASPD